MLSWCYFFNLGTLEAQQLGLYISPNDTLSSTLDIGATGFDAILLKADSLVNLNKENQSLRKFAYPWLSSIAGLTDEEIANDFIAKASTVFKQFEFISYHPTNLIKLNLPLEYGFDKYYTERVFSYLKVSESIPTNKKAWLFLSFLDYPYAEDQINENENLDVEALVFKSYSPDDYETRKLQRLLELAKKLQVKWLFLDQNHLLTALDNDPSLAIYLRAIQNQQLLAISSLEYSRAVNYNQFGSILIVVFVSLFVLHFSISFRYQRSIQRYFTNIRFFLQDIKSWRNAITFASWLVLTKFVGLHTLVQTALMSIVISPDGFTLLNNELGLFSFSVLSPFLNTFLNLLLINSSIHIVLLIWAKLINKSLRYFGQISSVYSYGLHSLFILLIPTYLLIENLPQSFWFISLTALALSVLIPINHFRTQVRLASIDTNGIFWNIGVGFLLFWVIFSGILFFLQLQFDWLNVVELAIAIP
jgi:hypothetical protein